MRTETQGTLMPRESCMVQGYSMQDAARSVWAFLRTVPLMLPRQYSPYHEDHTYQGHDLDKLPFGLLDSSARLLKNANPGPTAIV